MQYLSIEIDRTEALKPKTLVEVMKRADLLIQKRGMNKEYKILIEASIQKLVDLPPEADIIGSQWV